MIRRLSRARAIDRTGPGRRLGRRLGTAGAVAATAALVGTVVPTAAVHADAPTPVPFEGSFTDVNVCTGEPDEYHIESTLYLHVGHSQNSVDVADRHTGETASGFALVHGRSTFVATGTNVRVTLMDLWEHPQTGERLIVHFVFILDLTDLDVRVDSLRARCLPTGS